VNQAILAWFTSTRDNLHFQNPRMANSNRHGDWPVECKVYIGDLGSDGTRYELEDAFSTFGGVKNIWIAKKPPGKYLLVPC